MERVGYARVSTPEQNTDVQTDILERAGCDRMFIDHASGTLARRPELDAALAYLRRGDVLVITRLDRLGRSVKHLKDVTDRLQLNGVELHAVTQGIDTTTPVGRLFFHILAAIAEFEHDLIVERTKEGLASARARGRNGGGQFKMTSTQAEQARLMYDSKKYTVQQIADTFKVGRSTIYRHLEGTQ
jgi:DNA invertase Pin-like site-specific DNA recombinase